MNPIESIRTQYDGAIQIIAKLTSEQDRKYVPPLASGPTHDGSPHIEHEGTALFFVVTERGSEFERRRTTDPDELLYWLVCFAVFHVACAWELRNRQPLQDSRRLLFAKELELLEAVHPHWAKRKRTELNLLLTQYPYSDGDRPK